MTLIETAKQSETLTRASDSLLKKMVSVLDLTSLQSTDTEASIAQLCAKAKTPLGQVAAVCICPQFVPQVAKALKGSSVKVVTVANFPAGTTSLEPVLNDIKESIDNGAMELDVVLPYLRYFAGDKAYVRSFIQACKEACGNVILKIILETGAFSDLATLAAASEDAIKSGADFLKTGTGKIKVGATLEAVATILTVLQKLQPILKRKVGIKISGGIRTLQEAKLYMNLTAKMMGENWLNPSTFRIGASKLLDEIL